MGAHFHYVAVTVRTTQVLRCQGAWTVSQVFLNGSLIQSLNWPTNASSLMEEPEEYLTKRLLNFLKRINIVPPWLDRLWIYHKAPKSIWKEIQYGPNKHYINESGISQFASEALTLHSRDKHVELASLSTQELFNAHELLHSLTQNTNTEKDPSKV